MKMLLYAACLLTACSALRADDSKSAASKIAPVVDVRPATAPIYTPKTKSVFTSSTDQHNPFWPIGWVKMANETADTAATAVPHADDFTVTTILLNEPPMAVINGKEMAEGEVAPLPVNGASIVVQLLAVQDGRVILRWENQNIIVPIHRNEELNKLVAAPR